MQQSLDHLIELLTLEKIDTYLFKGESDDLGFPQVFGGQVIAQALRAGMETVDLPYHLHSCHAYFLQAGNAKQPIFYQVETLRHGKYFVMLNVTASQNEQEICRVMMSFHAPEQGFEHQAEMPNVAQAEQLISENQLLQQLAPHLPSPLKEKFAEARPFDVCLKYVNDPFNGKALPPEQFVWVKTNGQVHQEQRLQQCLLAYFSDFHCLITSLHPHEKGFLQRGMRIASLDHSIWFHREVDLNDWLLYALKSTNASAGRGMTSGQFFTKNGKLVASVQQEGLIRLEHAG